MERWIVPYLNKHRNTEQFINIILKIPAVELYTIFGISVHFGEKRKTLFSYDFRIYYFFCLTGNS